MTDSDSLIGRTLGGTIRIKKLLGRGGMGAVYEGYQEKLDRTLAVKVMTPEHAQNPVAPDYFLREARSASRLRHPNIIQIFDFGEDEELLYIAMEYVPGRSLEDVIEEQFPLGAERIVSILDQTLSALEEAHHNQIIHRDLKPENLMIEEARDGTDFVKVLDFGIAKPTGPGEDLGPLTRAGAVVGTPQFMSPEQARGQDLDPRSDLFSVGIILYNLLTSELPFTGKSMTDILVTLLQDDPLAPSAARPEVDVHSGLEAVCLRALQKKPDLRYKNATEFRRALERAMTDEEVAQKEDAPKMFVFKRSKDDDGSSRSTPGRRPSTGATAHIQAESDRDSGELETVISPQTSSPSSKTGGSEEAESDGRAFTNTVRAYDEGGSSTGGGRAYDFDLDEFKDDLMGEQIEASVLVVHQRSSQRVEPDEQKELRETLAECLEAAAREFDGIVHTRRGNCVPILFRMDSSRGDDPLRAAEAAIQLRERLRHATPDHVMFAFAMSHGQLHLPADGDYSRISGQCIDAAAERARAADDELIVATGEELRDALTNVYELGDVQDDVAPIEGLRESVRILEDAVDLIGREAEVAEILAVLGRLGRGEGGGVVFSGEAGMGKSALLAQLARLARQRGFLVVGARHRRPGAEGLRDILRDWLAEFSALEGGEQIPLEDLLDEYDLPRHVVNILCHWSDGSISELFGNGGRRAVPGSDFDADEAIEGAFRALFEAVSQQRPCVLVVDQIESDSELVSEFLSDWISFCQTCDVLFASAVRAPAGHAALDVPTQTRYIDVGPLDDATSEQLLKHRMSSAASDHVVERLAQVAGGIPVYLEQLAEQFDQAGSQEDEDLEDWLRQVDTLGGALRTRLFDQPRNVQNVLGLLAVAGSGARARWIDELASESWRVDEALQKLYDEGLIRVREPGARLFFAPPIFERVIYEQLSEPRRRRVHARIANFFSKRLRSIEDDDASRELRAELAEHLASCGKLKDAFKVTVSLAYDYLSRFEYASARQLYRKALKLGERIDGFPGRERAKLRLELSRLERARGDVRKAIDLVRPVYRDSDLPDSLQDEAALDLAELWLDGEDTHRVETLVRRSIESIRERWTRSSGGDDETRWLLVRALKVLGDALERQGKLGPAAEVLIEAVDLNSNLDLASADNPWRARLLWEPLNQLGRLRLRMGDNESAASSFERALDVADKLGDIQGELAVRGNIASLHASAGDFGEAYTALGEARALARGIGDLKSTSRLEYNLGLLYAKQHRWEEARDALEESRSLARSLRWREGIALTSEQLRSIKRSS